MEAIILAGGLGTRLRSVLPELPKAMAPVNGRPFLAFVLDNLAHAGFDSIILAAGYRHEVIQEYFGNRYQSLTLRYSVENEPLGTGGAIRSALKQTQAAAVFVLNGDTYLDLNFQAMLTAHHSAQAELTMAVHEVPEARRFGTVELDGDRVRGFLEKGRTGPGWINAGVYLVPPAIFAGLALPRAFSFENDFLVPHVGAIRPLAFEANGIFIDIGVPEDYARAQSLLGTVT